MKVWNFLNGKKRNIGLVLILIAQVLKASGIHMPGNTEDLINQCINYIGEGVGIIGLIHAAVKSTK